eukprot:6213298-Pleurochrysis_carterae.AAC.8
MAEVSRDEHRRRAQRKPHSSLFAVPAGIPAERVASASPARRVAPWTRAARADAGCRGGEGANTGAKSRLARSTSALSANGSIAEGRWAGPKPSDEGRMLGTWGGVRSAVCGRGCAAGDGVGRELIGGTTRSGWRAERVVRRAVEGGVRRATPFAEEFRRKARRRTRGRLWRARALRVVSRRQVKGIVQKREDARRERAVFETDAKSCRDGGEYMPVLTAPGVGYGVGDACDVLDKHRGIELGVHGLLLEAAL